MSYKTDKHWEYLGKNDPYYGVLSADKYNIHQLTDERKEDFFLSGRKHVERVFDVVYKQLKSNFRPCRSLDFGCGVGRLVIPIAEVSDAVVGVDVSDAMLQEAKDNCTQRGITNVTFIKSDDNLSKVDGVFDFIHSFIVFQHIPCKRGEILVKRLIDLLADEGVGALHFTYLHKSDRFHRIIYWARKTFPLFNGLLNVFVLHKPFSYPHMQMNQYDLNRLLVILQENNCHECYIQFSSHSSGHTVVNGVFLFFQKKAKHVSW